MTAKCQAHVKTGKSYITIEGPPTLAARYFILPQSNVPDIMMNNFTFCFTNAKLPRLVVVVVDTYYSSTTYTKNVEARLYIETAL